MDKRFIEKFGKKLKSIRLERELTQDDLACDANLSRSTISMIEVAKRDITLSKLKKLAKALGVEPFELIKFD